MPGNDMYWYIHINIVCVIKKVAITTGTHSTFKYKDKYTCTMNYHIPQNSIIPQWLSVNYLENSRII